MDAQALLQRCQSGDPLAIETLVRTHRQAVYRLALSVLDDPREADEATRDSFVAVVRALRSRRGKPASATRLDAITLELCRKRLRKRRLRERLRWVLRAIFRAPPVEADPGRATVQPKGDAALWAAIAALDENHRLPIVLRYYHDLSVAEIAGALRLREGAVRSRLSAARERLRVSLEPEPGADPGEAGRVTHLSHGEARRLIGETDVRPEVAELALLDAHLAECAECRRYSAELKSLDAAIARTLHTRWDSFSPSDDIAARVPRRMARRSVSRRRTRALPVAGGLSLILGTAMIGWQLLGRPPRPGPAPTEATALASPLPSPGVPVPKGLIAFQSERDGNHEIYVMNADGTGQRNLTRDPGLDLFPAWSPDGTRIAFLSDRADRGRRLDLYVMNSDGTGLVRLTDDTPGRWLWPLSWSPDGARLTAARAMDAADNRPHMHIYRVNADGSGVAPVVEDSDINMDPEWSPAGDRIAFVGLRYTSGVLFGVRPDGSELASLAVSGTRGGYVFDWSPDGARLAYLSSVRSYGPDGRPALELRSMSADGSDDRLILEVGHAQLFSSLAWSPDGRRLAFASDHEWQPGNLEPGSPEHQQLYVVWPDGWGLRRLMESAGRDFEPSWSPDGEWIAFTSNRDGDEEIFVIRIDAALRGGEGALGVRLTHHPGSDSRPAWQP